MTLFDAEKYRDRRVCVALSGGVDSVCLLFAFKAQAAAKNITLSAIHVEHGLRGEESLRDMRFCKALCADWEIPLKIVRADVAQLVKEGAGSVEETARAVRYAAFRALLEGGEADLVATAHHLDDVAETVLFRLARGTGLAGMRAIEEYGGVVRPLLSCTRAEIAAYADENALPHVEDSTNENENFTRNYIRKTALPAFEKIHCGAKKHLAAFASLAAEEDGYLQTLAENAIVRTENEARVPVDLPDVLFRRACLSLVRGLVGADYTRAAVEEIMRLRTAQSGKRTEIFARGETCQAVREGKCIVFCRTRSGSGEETAFVPAASVYAHPMPFSVREDGEDENLGHGALLVDLDAFPAGCVVRTRRAGDEITPYHAPHKPLKKFLTDRKIPARVSQNLPVIARGSEVYVVVGVEVADSVKVTEKTVRKGTIELMQESAEA